MHIHFCRCTYGVRRIRLLPFLAVCLLTTAPAVAQTTYSWNTSDGTWDSNPVNWDPAGGPPASGDDATFGYLPVAADAEVMLGVDTPAVDVLAISNGADLLTNGFDGEAATVLVDGTGSQLVIQDGTIFENRDLTGVVNGGLLLVGDASRYRGGEVALAGGGEAQMTGGVLEIRSDLGSGFLAINAGSELFGWGTIEFTDVVSAVILLFLSNEGTIRTARPFPDIGFARYEINFDNSTNESQPLIDLDGIGDSGRVRVAHISTLTILGTLLDDYSSTIDMGPGSILNISQPWAIDSGAVIDADAVQTMPIIPATFARIEWGELTVGNGATINVNSGTLEVDADLTVLAGSIVHVMENSTLQLDGNTIFLSSDPLNLSQNNTTLIVTDTTSMRGIFSNFDWDGSGNDLGHATTEINEGALLEINVGTFEMVGDPYQYDGTLNINGGAVDVRVNNDDTTPWVMDRNLNLANTNGTVAVVTGNPLEFGNGTGTLDALLNVSGIGVSWIIPETTLRSDAVVEIADGAVLDLEVGAVVEGGTLDLQGGAVTGGLVRNNGGTIRGNGRIASTSINNFGTIEGDGGTLVIDTVNASQLDGAAPNNGQGVLRAETGDLEIASNVTTVFNGQLVVGSTRTFTMSQPGSRFRNAPASEDGDDSGDFGEIQLLRGKIIVEQFEQASRLSSISNSTLEADEITFENGSLTEIVPNRSNELQLDGNTTVEAGAAFGGGGTLRNLFNSTLTLLEGAQLDGVHLRNDGRLEIGSSVGAAIVDSFEQSSLLTATWTVEIGGTAPGSEHDQLIVINDVQLDGTLEVELIDLGGGQFAPSLGDMFEILVADSVHGGFQQTLLPELSAGLFWHVVTQPDVLLVAVADYLSGDYNRNGAVDAADYTVWRDALGSTVDLAADGNFDRTVDEHDYDVWAANFGAVAASASLAAVPEPAATLLLAIGVAGVAGAGRLARIKRCSRSDFHHPQYG